MSWLLKMIGLHDAGRVHAVVDGAWQMAREVQPWLIVGLIVVGGGLAAINLLPWISMRPSVRLWTFFLRLGIVGLLIVLLVGLEWHLDLLVNKPQEWAVLVDDSASMASEDAGGASRHEAALADLDRLRRGVGRDVKLRTHSFSGGPLNDQQAGEGPTRFRDAVRRAALSRAEVDRLVILTDGRDSERRDLFRLGDDLEARGINVAVRLYGSRTAPEDAGITAEPERSVLRLGEQLVVRGALTGKPPQGELVVQLQENGRKVKQFTVAEENNWRFDVRYRPEKKGRHVYTLRLPTGDAVTRNDAINFNVDVIEDRINVLMIEGMPRFEFKVLKTVLEVDPLVDLVTISHLPGSGVYVQGEPLHRNPEQGLIESQAELFKYDVVVLRDVPRNLFRAGGDTTETRLRHIVEFVVKRGGGLIALGGQDVYRAGGYQDSHLAEVLPFDLSDRVSRTDQFKGLFFVSIPKPAYDHPVLRLLDDPAANRERLNALRQLDGSNNVGWFKPLATPLMTRIVEVPMGDRTEQREAPVLGYMAVGEGKVIAGAADTFWRWQLQPDFEDPPLTMMLANMVRFVAPPPDTGPNTPSVDFGDGTPQVGQELVLASELRDSNFDPIRDAELVVTVSRPDGSSYRMFPRDLPEEPGRYEYRVMLDQPGRYGIRARHGEDETVREFLAGASAGEFVDLSVDREGVERLVETAGGEIIDGGQAAMERWLDEADTRPRQVAAVRDLEVWNSPLVLILLIVLVSADCYVRKRQGLV